MKLLDCNNLRVEPFRTYGGATGSKIGVWYNDKLYMLKTQQNVKKRGFKNVEISYANDPVSEYIGSHIYELCDVPAHETILGEYHGKLCVLCRDYSYPGKIIEFREWRNQIMSENVSQHHSGMSSKISDIMQVIDSIDVFDKDKVKQRFWDMFVIDALIGNTDRNNGNWGFYVNDSILELYCVYDCGACLNNKKSDEQFSELIRNGGYKSLAYDFTTSFQDDSGNRINPLHYIRDNRTEMIISALALLPDDFRSIEDIVHSVKPVISNVRCNWYNKVMKERFDLLKSYKRSYSESNPFTRAIDIMS